jgi:Icc-related predicted phosphoesterase
MRDELRRDLQQVADQVSKLVVVIHTAPLERALERGEVPDPFDAYEGSSEFGELLKAFAQQREIVVICGHRHAHLDIEENGMRVLRNPIGYLNREVKDYVNQARKAIAVFQL